MINTDLETGNTIANDALVRVKRMGNIVEILFAEHISRGGSIRKLDAEQYVVLSTGEVKQFSHEENRADCTESIRKSMSMLRDLINTNVTAPHKCRWMTLTYAENMTDTRKLLNDFKNFNTRCRREYHDYGKYEYIAVAEPQGRGAWHLHVILIFPQKAPHMENERIRALWGHGFVSIKALNNIDNVGAYLTAYLGDVELEDYKKEHPDEKYFGEIKDVRIVDHEGKEVNKRIVKGARLSMYPPGMHIYRCSKGIRKPTVAYMRYKIIKAEIGDAKMTYKRKMEIGTEDTFQNTFVREIYNTKRKSNKKEGKSEK